MSAMRRIFIICAFAFLLVPVTSACNNTQTPVKENEAAFEYKIPQIDAGASAVTETATFAMG